MMIELKVWWVPQIPMKSFEYKVDTLKEGRMLVDVLAKYDLFQFENRIKPDYCNTGGIVFKEENLTEGEWWDVPDDEDEIDDFIRECRERGIPVTPLEIK